MPQILAIPFLIWAAMAWDGAQQQREQREQRQRRQQERLREQRDEQRPTSREREETVLYRPTELQADELRQQLLPLAFW